MSNVKILENALQIEERNNLYFELLSKASRTSGSKIPESMSKLISLFGMSNFASQFQIKIKLGNVLVPTNMVGFVLAHSGASKDSTITAVDIAIEGGYRVINDARKEKAKEKAISIANEKDESDWQKYYKEPLPLQNSLSTVEGLVYRMNLFQKDGIGMPSIIVSELGSELQSSSVITDNIRLIAETYDLGIKRSKALKNQDLQDKEVRGMGLCGLFVGSEDNILLDTNVSKKFKLEFLTKLARRSHFVYPTKEEFEELNVEYSNLEEMLTSIKENIENANMASKKMNQVAIDIATHWLNQESNIIEISEDALLLYNLYKMYCNELAEEIGYKYKSCYLEHFHRHWKTLKIAGVFAFMDCRNEITKDDLLESIWYSESIGKYMELYEIEANKDTHELLVDYLIENGEISFHEMKKRGFIVGTGSLDNKVKEIVKLADSYVKDGLIVVKESDVVYEPIEKADRVGVSGKKMPNEIDKDKWAMMSADGFKYKQMEFENLVKVVSSNVAYSPFKFKDGYRKDDNIDSGTSWVVLDVDNSDESIYEVSDILGDIKHIIATTSKKDNQYKFRLLVKLSCEVNLPSREWKKFLEAIADDFSINADKACFTRSQIFFGYKDSIVLTNFDGEEYNCLGALRKAKEYASIRKVLPTGKKAKEALANPLVTFDYAFKDDVPRSLNMFKVWKHAKELGASMDECEQLMIELNDFWSNPISDKRLDRYIEQMRKSFEF